MKNLRQLTSQELRSCECSSLKSETLLENPGGADSEKANSGPSFRSSSFALEKTSIILPSPLMCFPLSDIWTTAEAGLLLHLLASWTPLPKGFHLAGAGSLKHFYFASTISHAHYLLQQNISIYLPLNCALLDSGRHELIMSMIPFFAFYL